LKARLLRRWKPHYQKLCLVTYPQIVELSNVTYRTGAFYVKWYLPHSVATEHHGRTRKVEVKDHKVVWNHEITAPLRMTVDTGGTLQESWLHLEILVEHPDTKPSELGTLKLNLAEYVEASEHSGEEGVSRRYLLQDSKVNSTITVQNHSPPADKPF
jgi:hypothetical protein